MSLRSEPVREPRAVPTEETQRWIGTFGLLGGATVGVLVYGLLRPDWSGLRHFESTPVEVLLVWMVLGATVAGSLVELVAWAIMRPFVKSGFVWRGHTPERRAALGAEFAWKWRNAQRLAIALTPRQLWLRLEVNAVLAIGAGTGAVFASRARGDVERALTFGGCVFAAFVAYVVLSWTRARVAAVWARHRTRRSSAAPRRTGDAASRVG